MNKSLNRKADIEEEGKTKIKEVAADLAEDFERLGQATHKIASHSLDAMKEELGDLYKQGQKKATEVSGQLESRIRSHPLQTLFLAAGIGFVVGWLKRK